MSLIARDHGGGDYKPLPEGSHVAVCDMLVDLGKQSGPYGTKEQIVLRFEVPAERIEYEKDGQMFSGPMTIVVFYTNSLSQKANLRQDLEGWRGRAFSKEELEGFELRNVVGKACILSVTHKVKENGDIRAKVNSISQLPKGMEAPRAENPLLVFDLETMEGFDDLPEWLQQKVTNRVDALPGETVADSHAPRVEDPLEDDEIPF